MISNIFRRMSLRSLIGAVLILAGIGLAVRYVPHMSINGRSLFASPKGPALLAVILFSLWMLYLLGRWLLRRSGRLRVMWEAAPPKEREEPRWSDDDRAAYAAQTHIRQRFQAARRLLRKGGPAWRLGRASLYRLPWYVVIGAGGSGKSALLQGSGLKFSDDDGILAAVSGAHKDEAAPVRFWIGGRAVFLESSGLAGYDAAGRPGNRSVWRFLVRQIKRARRRCPINGVVVTLDARELLAVDDAGRAQAAATVRGRLRDLQTELGILFPVYLVVTCCDLLEGFDAYFEEMDSSEREQVWGITFPLQESEGGDAVVAAFPSELQALVLRLQSSVADRVGAHTAVDRRVDIYGFPLQFESLGRALERWLPDAFACVPHAPDACLRGVYFTSAAQAGAAKASSASPLARQLRASVSAVAREPSRQAFFIARLVREVMLQEQGLAGRRLRSGPRQRLVRRFAVGVLLAAVLATSAAIWVAYARNRTLVMQSAQTAAELEARAARPLRSDDVAGIVSLLDAARSQATVEPENTGRGDAIATWLSRHILYEGTRLHRAAHRTYRDLLRQVLLPYLAYRASSVMSNDASSLSDRYLALRTYLMLGEPRRYDASVVATWAHYDALSLDPSQRTALMRHVNALLLDKGFRPALALDAKLVGHTRAALADHRFADRVFDGLLPQLEAALPEPLSVVRMGGVDAPLALRRLSGKSLTGGVSGAFTLDGYRRYLALRDAAVAAAANAAWVMGPLSSGEKEAPRDLNAQLDQIYFQRYIAAWDALIDDVRLVALSSTGQQAGLVRLLAGPDSPLRKFLQAAALQTTLGGAKGEAATTPVDQHFAALHRLFREPAAGGLAPINRVQSQLNELAVYLDALESARESGLPIPAGDALAKLQDSAQAQPVPLGTMLGSLVSGGEAVASDTGLKRLNALWQANVVPFCRAALDRRYPMDPGSKLNVTRDDFARLFAPGGLIDDFFQQNLLAYVDTTRHPWRWRTGVAVPHLSPAALRQFEDAAAIRDAFFPAGDRKMQVRFQLTPISLDPALNAFTITLGGQSLQYAHGPLRPSLFQWPASGAAMVARIDYDPADPGGSSGWAVSGPWALFRLLDRGRLTSVDADRYVLSFDRAGRKAVFALNASSVVNPFALPALHRFHCLDTL